MLPTLSTRPRRFAARGAAIGIAFVLVAACGSDRDEAAGQAETTNPSSVGDQATTTSASSSGDTAADDPVDTVTTTTATTVEATESTAVDADDDRADAIVDGEFIEEQLQVGWSDGVQCRITSGASNTFDGPCLFFRDGGGSFSVQTEDGSPILNEVLIISVAVVAEGRAEVRGLTASGINSRWGAATRSETQPACWTGADFEVCAF